MRWREEAPQIKNETPLRELAQRLMDFCARFDSHFIGNSRNSVDHARHYVSGLMGAQRRKNIETIENDVPGSNYQGMEQFISTSPWSHRDLLDDVAREADRHLGHGKDAGLYIDESSFLKKGKASVGVQRQWSGHAGKVENCQVGVFACLGRGTEFVLTDLRLYLPESWADDPERCDKAGIPIDGRSYKAKWELALEMVAGARQNGVRFGWVGVDSLYGNNKLFLNGLEDAGERFMADVHKDFNVWIPRPGAEDDAQPVRVDELVEACFEESHRELSWRQGSKGKLCARIWVTDVWVGDPRKDGEPRRRRLVVRQDESGDFKYSLTNLPPQSWKRDAYVQGQRYWIEHGFHEAKSQLGMAQYQVRVWRGWHHHMALVILSTLFMQREKTRLGGNRPLISYRDITELLDFYLPRRNRNEKEVLAQISKRHKARQRDIDRRRSRKTGIPSTNSS